MISFGLNRVVATAGAAAVLIAPAAFADVAPKPAAPATALGEREMLGEAQRFRRELHLRADAGYLRDLAARHARNDSRVREDSGILMTVEESREMADREEAARSIAATARAHFKRSAGEFGGVYLDHATGDTVVLVVGDVAGHDTALRRKVSEPDRLTTRPARFPLALLESLTSQIADDGVALKAAGAEITGVTLFEQDNVVEVALVDDTDAARRIVASRYPRGALRFTGPTSRSTDGVEGLNAPPLKGGQGITSPVTGTTRISVCTSGYVTYRYWRTDASIWVTDYYLTTAGHCDENQQRFWSQATTYGIGVSEMNRYVDGSTADAMRIPIRPTDRSQHVAITATNDRLMLYSEGQNADVVNTRVCVSGARTGGEQCGTLTSKTYNDPSTFPPPRLRNQRLATYFSQGGDSGGSVLNNSTAKGVHSGRVTYSDGTSHAVYSHIYEVLLRTGQTNIVGV